MAENTVIDMLRESIEKLDERLTNQLGRIEGKLDALAEENGEQNITIDRNKNRIETIGKDIEKKTQRSMWIIGLLAPFVVILVSEILKRYVFN